jgi:phosphatidylglycerol lysyltransferase
VSERLRRVLPVLIGVVLFGAALEVLRLELRTVTWHDLVRDIVATPPSRLWLALLLTAINYALLTGYDFLAFAYIGKTLSRRQVAATAFLAYAIANNIGFSALSGASVRYRFYSRWGITWEELSRLVFSYSLTFWLGLLTLGGLSLAFSPLHAAGSVAAYAPILGWMLLAAVAALVATSMFRHTPFKVRSLELPLPSPRLVFLQLGVSVLEWGFAGAVLYVLLPPSGLTFLGFLGAFFAAILIGMASHVPGGVGVFEGLMVLLLKPYLSSGQLLPALAAYRAVYYLLPLVVALIALVADELQLRRSQAVRAGVLLGHLTELLTPRLLALFTFLSGLLLLFSGATPAAPGRLGRLAQMLPLELIEASHFTGSVAGALLLIVSQGLSRRLDAAYYVTVSTIAVGIAASLLKGLDYEEAIWLSLVLLVLWRARPAFDRRAAFFETRFSAGWIGAVIGALAASVWLGFFAFKHVDYSNDLWWQFEVRAETSRFLRASIGASVVVLLFGVARLLRPAPHEIDEPTDADLDAAAGAIATQTATYPNLAYLKDKGLLFDESRSGFVMYGVQGSTWVALGDPVGPPQLTGDLVRLFLERCDDFGGTPVFYEIPRANLHHYADFGLAFVKLGEEARVDLRTFTMDGGTGARFRQAMRRLDKDSATFRIVDVADVPPILGQLRQVSDDWLSHKSAAEKGFSLGFFDEDYLRRFPMAVVEREGRIVAFANLWPGTGRHELSIDLMRYHREAPKGVMEALLAHLLWWGKGEGYQWFALGMAPLSGFESSPVAPLWNRLGALLYEHGEGVYNFQGLRAYKDKFNPVWEPHYLAYPGGLGLPRVLADVSALVAGGYHRIFLK